MDVDDDTLAELASKWDRVLIPVAEEPNGVAVTEQSATSSPPAIASISTPSLLTQQSILSSTEAPLALSTVESEYHSSLSADKAYLQQILSLQLSNAYSAFHPLFSDFFEPEAYDHWSVTSENIEYGKEGIIGAPKDAKQFEKWLRGGDLAFLAHHRQCCEVLELIRQSFDENGPLLPHTTSEHMQALNEMQNDQVFLEQLLAGAIVDSGLVCLIGPRNSGKSHLLRRVLEKLVHYDEIEADKTMSNQISHFPAPLLPIRVITLQALQTQDPFDLLLYILEDLRQIVKATDEERNTIAEIQNDVELATKHLGTHAGDVYHRSRLHALREKYSKVLQQTIEVIRKVTLSRQLVIVLEDFDLLAGERQTFLYNLMDIISHGYVHNQKSGGAQELLMQKQALSKSMPSKSGPTLPDPLDINVTSDEAIKSALDQLLAVISESLQSALEANQAFELDVIETANHFGISDLKEAEAMIINYVHEAAKTHLAVLPDLKVRIEQLIQRNIDRSSIKDADELAREEVQAALAASMGIIMSGLENSTISASKASISDIIADFNDILDAVGDLVGENRVDAMNGGVNEAEDDDPSKFVTRTPISAVMVTSRLDSFSMLEKRVASRFPQRQIIMNGPTKLSEMLAILFQHLIISEIPLPPDRFLLLRRRQMFRDRSHETSQKAEKEGIQFSEDVVFSRLDVFNHPLSSHDEANQEDHPEGRQLSETDRNQLRELQNSNSVAFGRLVSHRQLIMEWNESVMALFRAKPRVIWHLLDKISETTLNIEIFFRVFLSAISESPSTLLSPKALEASLSSFLDASSRIQSGLSCSMVQIMLLIEMSRLERQIMFGWEKSGSPFVDVHLPTDAMASNLGAAQLAKGKGKRKMDGTQTFYSEPGVVAARQDRFRLQRYHFERVYYEYRKWITINHHLKAYKLPKAIIHKEFEKLVQMRFVHFSGNDRYRHSQQSAPQGALAYAYHHLKLAISSWELDEIIKQFPEPLHELILDRAKL